LFEIWGWRRGGTRPPYSFTCNVIFCIDDCIRNFQYVVLIRTLLILSQTSCCQGDMEFGQGGHDRVDRQGGHEMGESSHGRSARHGVRDGQQSVPSRASSPTYHHSRVHLDPIYFNSYSHHSSRNASGIFQLSHQCLFRVLAT
jgi:hypothetical protein